MNTTKEQMKARALEIMKRLDIFKPYIEGFRDENKVCFFENFGGYWVDQEPEIEAKMREIENKYNCVVYAITHEFMEFGELYDFLLVTPYEEEWDDMVYSIGSRHTAFAYVWNRDYEPNSELGDITVKSFGGGIKRIA